MEYIKFMYKDKIKKIISIVLLIITFINLIVTCIPFTHADSLLGTNKALGSPILNQSAVSDDWNKYESFVWGIFLSNLCTPFVDNYESAFNLSSNVGTKGKGLKALSFSSGSDVSNNKVLKDLVTYAINTQGVSAKKVEVSYTTFKNGSVICANNFGSTTLSDPSTAGTYQAAPTRGAVLRDLFMGTIDYTISGDEFSYDSTYADKSWVGGNDINKNHTGNKYIDIYNRGVSKTTVNGSGNSNVEKQDGVYLEEIHYPDIAGAVYCNLPTFAVSASGGYEVVFDFTSPYDIEMFVGALAYGLNSDNKSEATKNIKELIDKPLYIDSFGNLTVYTGSRYIVIVPASANQYLTKEKKQNFVNSMIFNAGTTADSKDNLINNAGTNAFGKVGAVANWFIGDSDITSKSLTGGGNAFANGSSRTRNSGMAVFYDTDNIVMQDKIKSDGTLNINSFYNPSSGDVLKKLFNANPNTDNNYNLKIEPMNISSDIVDGFDDADKLGIDADATISDAIIATFNVSSTVSNIIKQPVLDRLTSIYDFTAASKDDDIKLFDKAVIIAANMPEGQSDNGKFNSWEVYRRLLNYIYEKYNAGNQGNVIDPKPEDIRLRNDIETILGKEVPVSIMNDLVQDTVDGKGYSPLALSFIENYSTDASGVKLYEKIGDLSTWSERMGEATGSFATDTGGADWLVMRDVSNVDKATKLVVTDTTGSGGLFGSIFGTELGNNSARSLLTFGRVLKLFYVSDTLEQVSAVLGIRDGTSFHVFAPNIYYTYIKWYGLKKNMDGTFTAEFNEKILNPDATIEDISEVTDITTQEDKEKAILDYAYLSLHPTAGREYRNNIMMSKMSSVMYTQYQRIVYGGADTYYYSTVTTKDNTGFLNVPNYSENFMTAWFMQSYAKLAIVLIGIGTLLTVVIALIKRRKITWVILGIALVVNVVLVLPSTGEIVPYVSNELVQELFENNMTFWSVSELAATSSSAANQKKPESVEDQTVNRLINSIKSIYLDRYLSIKQDISNKVVQDSGDYLTEIQEFRSARWLLPMVMRQWTNNEGTADYVYVTLGDKLEDACNIYCYFDNSASNYVGYFNDIKDSTDLLYYDIDGRHKDSGIKDNPATYYSAYEKLSFTDTSDDTDHRARSLKVTDGNAIHTYFYILDNEVLSDITLQQKLNDLVPRDGKSFEEWAKEVSSALLTANTQMGIEQAYSNIVSNASDYNRYTRDNTNYEYGYLWMTESPLTYFYINTAETFRKDGNVGTLANDLLGEYRTDASSGEEYRYSVMASDSNHEVRDFMDLENMFKNVIPYMYSMQLLAGGYNSEGGVFGDELIGNTFPLYKDNEKSWIFRSNWVTKIVENKEFNGSAKVKDADGVEYTIQNQMAPECYPAERPMVFSAAQMYENGLTEEDLSYVELKCVDLNNKMYKQWTLMVNYIGLKGMSREVMYRQMAIDSTMEFFKEFDKSTFTTPKHRLYPTTLDLRSISFDSVMKMLMLNVTKNTSYIFGDSMDVLIDESDVISQVLLIICAVICVKVIPLVRCVALGLMFYLGYASVIKTLFKDSREKVETSLGYTGCNLVMLILNLLYLSGFRVLMSATNSDQVLNLNTASVSVGNPDWCFIAIIFISVLYTFSCGWLVVFCFKNFRDMGFSAFKGVINMTATSISSGFERIMGKMAESSAVSDVVNSDASPAKHIQTPVNQGVSGNSGATNSSSSTTGGGSGSQSRNNNTNTTMDTDTSVESDRDEYHYESNLGDYKFVDSTADEINDRINKGKQVDSSTNSNQDEYSNPSVPEDSEQDK